MDRSPLLSDAPDGASVNSAGRRSDAHEEEGEGIFIDNVVRSYGRVAVLSGLSLEAKRGTIYGLLGPSGCGKTTLLKCILGRLVPDSGIVRVLGCPPNTENSGVPGRKVGYAPQEIALYADLSVRETLDFHATMNGIVPHGDAFKARLKWIKDLLELPRLGSIVGKLSGGQQRRVSLAAALLHGPELLVLDEPTVGVDPLLRMRIWKYLRTLADAGVTIIVTTHYIEEARQADLVGLMRDGALLAQGPPRALMSKYGFDTLEDVFLMLCRNFEREQRKRDPVESDVSESRPVIMPEPDGGKAATSEAAASREIRPHSDSDDGLSMGVSAIATETSVRRLQGWAR
jgi:ATP-binding cassette, subfamily H